MLLVSFFGHQAVKVSESDPGLRFCKLACSWALKSAFVLERQSDDRRAQW